MTYNFKPMNKMTQPRAASARIIREKNKIPNRSESAMKSVQFESIRPRKKLLKLTLLEIEE